MPFNLNKIAAIIFYRKSSKGYIKNKAIPREDLFSFFEAARWAPSAKNIQPWRYLLFTEDNPEQIAKMRSCLNEGNQIWANNAPVLILACADTVTPSGDINPVALHDLGLANENLLIQIRSMGYNCRPMGGFDKKKAKLLFDIPEHIQPVIVIAAGHSAKLSTLPENIQEEEKKPRMRDEINTWVYQSTWGTHFSE